MLQYCHVQILKKHRICLEIYRQSLRDKFDVSLSLVYFHSMSLRVTLLKSVIRLCISGTRSGQMELWLNLDCRVTTTQR